MQLIIAVQHGLILACLLLQVVTPSGMGSLLCTLVVAAISIVSLVSAFFGRVATALSSLALLVAYELIIPVVLPGFRMIYISVVALLVSVVLAARSHKASIFGYIFILAALISGIRFLLDGYAPREATSFVRLMFVGTLFVFMVGWLPRVENTIPVISSTGLACAGVALISIANAIYVWGLNPLDLISANFRLANVDGLGPNSYALVCGIGVLACHSAYVNTIGIHRNMYAGSGLVCLLAAILSKSLGTIIPLTIILAVHFVRGQRSFLINIILLAASAMLLVEFVSLALEFDSFSLETRDFTTVSGRNLAWSYSLGLISNNPFFGVSFSDYSSGAPVIFYTNSLGEVQEVIMTPHNLFVENFVYFGIFLGGFMSLVVVRFVLYYGGILLKGTPAEASIGAISVLGLIVHMTVDQWGLLFYWIFLLSSVLLWSGRARNKFTSAC